MEISKSKNISFNARIIYSNGKKFLPLVLKPGKYYRQIIHPQREYVLAKKAYTDDAKDCTIGGVENGKQVFLFHYNPRDLLSCLTEVRALLKKNIEILKHNGKELSAILTGGWKNDANGDSEKAFKALDSIICEEGIIPTKMWGQSIDNNARIFCNARKRLWLIKTQHWRKKTPELQTPADIKKTFLVTDIAPRDTFYIEETPIDAILLKRTSEDDRLWHLTNPDKHFEDDFDSDFDGLD